MMQPHRMMTRAAIAAATAIEDPKPEIVEACRRQYAEDPEGTKPALECALFAATFEELEACPAL